jgi:hypothetical protein
MKVQHSILAFILLLALAVVTVFLNPVEVEVPVPVEVEVPVPVEVPVVTRTPEFREPPTKTWKPPHFQQMGLLSGTNGETLPLYGKQSYSHSDRYHYYTTTPGEQIFPLPITHNGRDCTEDIGCPEFYGNENIQVFGKDGDYTTKIYRTTLTRNLL